MAEKIYKFDRELIGMNLKPSYEVTIDKKKVIHRLVEGDSELDIKNQSENATPIYFNVGTFTMVVEDETTQKWLEGNPLFKNGKITVYDPIAVSKAETESIKDEMNIINEVIALDDNDALSLGYAMYHRESLSLDKDVLRNRLLKSAMNDAVNVKSKMDKKQNAEELFLGSAFAMNIIYEAESGTKVKWNDNDVQITDVTKGLNGVEEMLIFTQTAEGKIVKQEIQTRIKSKLAKMLVDSKKTESNKK